ncbi:hypothetical protein [Actinoplanes sp. NPDC051851]|uniref:hypothetical protein n=1 Tax=Actinoplanes sp. NPDC051851 TaxID=3154753 RepID=UPI00341D488F
MDDKTETDSTVRVEPQRISPWIIVLGVLVAALLVGGGVALGALAGGSGGGGATAGPAAAASDPARARTVAFAQCIRDHGVPDFPDPDANGVLAFRPDQGIDIESDTYKAAEAACASLRPSGAPAQQGPAPGTANGPDTTAYVACMRKNGLPDFPDPDKQGMFIGIDVKSAAFTAAQEKCRRYLPGGAPEPSA